MQFISDNCAGVHPDILAAIVGANEGDARSYGGDDLTAAVERRFCEIFERDVAVFFVPTGTAANALALAQVAAPGSLVLCHRDAHAMIDECAAPERMSGAKLVGLGGEAAKLSPETVISAVERFDGRMPARALSVTQATECGTAYSPAEITALAAVARANGMKLHMDGARFSNALAALSCSPAEATWKAGVDVLSFGGTKNGCLAAEAVVFFNPPEADGFAYRRRGAGHLVSKMRFMAAQFDAYLSGGLWLRMARQANEMAKRLAGGLEAAGLRIVWPVEANEVFAAYPPALEASLKAAGVGGYRWVTPETPAEARIYRHVCSWATRADEVDRFVDLVSRA